MENQDEHRMFILCDNDIAEQDTKINQNACLFEMGVMPAGAEWAHLFTHM